MTCIIVMSNISKACTILFTEKNFSRAKHTAYFSKAFTISFPSYLKMANQKVTFKNKAVIVRVYVEKPRKKRPSSNEHHHHHHHHHHFHVHNTFRRELANGSASRGYDRRAELLKYSQRLRESAQEAPSTPPLTRQISNINRKSKNQIVPSSRKAKYDSGRAGCFGNWKLLIPSFIRSWTVGPKSKERKEKRVQRSGWPGKKITNAMKKLQMKGKRNFILSAFSTTRKRS